MPEDLVRFLITFAVFFLLLGWMNRRAVPVWQRVLIGGVVGVLIGTTEQVLRQILR